METPFFDTLCIALTLELESGVKIKKTSSVSASLSLVHVTETDCENTWN